MSVSLKYLLKDIKKNELELIAGEKGLKNKKDEINFFRNNKPKIQGKLFHYNKVTV